MRKYNAVVAVLAIASGLLIFWFSRNLSLTSAEGIPGEAFWPHMIASLLILLGVLQGIEVVAFPTAAADRTVGMFGPAQRQAFLTALLAFGFAVLMSWLGFIIAVLIFMPLVMLQMGERRPHMIALTTILAVAVIWFFFVKVFSISLPVAAFLE